MLVCHLLSIVSTIEVVACEGALGAGHIATNDEVGAPIVLADDHMLDGLTRAGHVHGVGEVGPAQAGVVHLGLEHFVGLVTDGAWDVIILCGAHSGVHQASCARVLHVGCVQGTDEQLIVGAVDGVAALESQHVLILGQGGTDLSRALAGKHTCGHLQALQLATQVELATLKGDHLHCGVLQCGHTVHLGGLLHLIRDVLGAHV
mmetsp:Transcript_21426/g.36564  ORF Transcript_21426/g.36564 Transcript_21426/m.36564 type:complete len:204 (-) Transcript_21426:12-623(-)